MGGPFDTHCGEFYKHPKNQYRFSEKNIIGNIKINWHCSTPGQDDINTFLHYFICSAHHRSIGKKYWKDFD